MKPALKAIWHRCLLCLQSTEQVICPLCLADCGFVNAPLLTQDLVEFNLNDTTEHFAHDVIVNAKFDGLWVLDIYQYPLSVLIPKLKFYQQPHLARLMAHWFILHRVVHMDSLPDVLIPIPIHWRRMWRRGYNQSQLLCDELSRCLKIPCLENAVMRKHYTKPQSELNLDARRANIKGVFKVDIQAFKDVSHIAIVDDVITTGTTMNDLCRSIYQVAPHIRITVWCMGLSVYEPADEKAVGK